MSVTADPVAEVKAGRETISALGLGTDGGINVISCPTCGRTKIDLIGIGKRYKEAVYDLDTKGKNLKVAVMGCAVNGPGEAREADFGVAGGVGEGLLFKKGEIIGKAPMNELADRLMSLIEEA